MTNSLPLKTQPAVEVIKEKGSSSWLSVIPLKEMKFTLNKTEFRDEIRDLEAEILRAVCTDVEVELVLQEVTGEVLPRGAHKAPDVRLDIRAQGFWAREQSAFFDVRVCHPNAYSDKNLT